MKKNYFITLLLTLCFSSLSFGQVIITELADPNNDAAARYVEIYNLGNSAEDLTGWSLKRYTNGNSGLSTNVVDLSSIGSLASGAFAIIAANATNFQTVYGMAADIDAGTGGPADSNGDDQIVLYNASDAVVDIFGVPGEDGTGTCHEFEDGRAERKGSVSAANTTWTESEWNVWADSTVSGCTSHTNSPRTSPTDFDPKAWIGTATTPTLTINAPSAGAIANTTSVTPTITIANFSVSGDNGSGSSDGTGDGFIKSTFETQGGATENSSFFSATLPAITVAPGNTYTLTLELVDNAGTSLNPAVSQSVTFNVEHPCDLVLGDIATSCDAITSGNDGFSGTIAFTGGNTGTTYTITAPAGVTVGGDNPDTVAAGTITFSGMTEGTNAEINIAGGASSSCDLTRTLYSPNCIPFPVVETFDYTANTDLIASNDWSDASTSSTPNNIQVVTGTIANPFTSNEYPDPTGNMVTLSEGGSDPFIAFNGVNEVFASFLFTATDMSAVSNPNGGYFVVLAQPSGSFRARLWVKPDATDGAKFNIGVSSSSSANNYSPTAFSTGVEVFIVMSYNTANDEIKVWINPSASTFEGTPAASDLTESIGSTEAVGRFILRQDSTSETASINFDELRIDTNWSGVTPKGATASVGRDNIEGFAAYPNPVNNKKFTVKTSSSSSKIINVFNVLGKKVFTQTFSGQQKTMDVSVLNSGIYILKVTQDGKTSTKKLVIR